MNQYGGREPGDPAKAAEAVLRAVDSPDTPLRLVLGADALDRARAKLSALEKNYAAWESVTRGTNIG
jgi:hypothetical protein